MTLNLKSPQIQTVTPYQRANDTLDSFVIHMFQKGITTSGMADLIERVYGHQYTPQTIPNMTQAIETFRERTLEKHYVWKSLIEDIQTYGFETMLLFILDGLKDMKEHIHEVFPKANYQTCFMNISRNIAHKVRVSDRKKSYPKITQSLKDRSDLYTFYNFLKAIRRSIYSTNLIKSFNKRIKHYSKRQEQFPNETSLDRLLVAQFEDYNQQFSILCHIVFDKAREEIIEMFN